MLDVLALFGVAVLAGFLLAVALVFAALGRERLGLAWMLASAARSRNPKLLVALVRTGRSIVPTLLRYEGNKYWGGSIHGRRAVWRVEPPAVYRLAGADVVVTTDRVARAFEPKDLVNLEAISSPYVRRHILSQVRAEALALLDREGERLRKALEETEALLDGGRAENPEELEADAEAIRRRLGELERARARVARAESLSDLAEALRGFRSLANRVFVSSGLAVDFDALDPVAAIDPVSLETIAKERTLQKVAEVLGEKREEKRASTLFWIIVLATVLVMVLALLALAPHAAPTQPPAQPPQGQGVGLLQLLRGVVA